MIRFEIHQFIHDIFEREDDHQIEMRILHDEVEVEFDEIDDFFECEIDNAHV